MDLIFQISDFKHSSNSVMADSKLKSSAELFPMKTFVEKSHPCLFACFTGNCYYATFQIIIINIFLIYIFYLDKTYYKFIIIVLIK
jgi:hypothetical protein